MRSLGGAPRPVSEGWHRADAIASKRSAEHVDYCEFLLGFWTPEDLNPLPVVSGHDLMQHGVPTGPIYKKLLDAVREGQLDGKVRTKAQALELVDRDAGAAHHVGQREHDDVGVGGREGDRDGRQAEQQPRGCHRAGHGAVICFSVP